MSSDDKRIASTHEPWYAELQKDKTDGKYPDDLCLHDLFIAQALKTPESLALVDINEQLTYNEVHMRTDMLAHQLREAGVRTGDVCGIYMERCVDFVLSYVAILKAGGAYMPLEVAYPEKLLASVLLDSQPVVVLTKKAWVENLKSSPPQTVILQLDSEWYTQSTPANFALESAVQRAGKTGEDLERSDFPSPDTLAYVVYSSGTTGKPKGICCPHRGAVHSYNWRNVNYPYQPGDRVGCNVFFVWEVVRALLFGSTSVVIPDDTIYDPVRLVDFLHEYRITRVLFTPSLMQTVVDTMPSLHLLEGLDIIWLCGEVVTTDLRNKIINQLPNLRLLNLFSISECHDVSVKNLSLPQTDAREFQSCGIAMMNVGIYVLDDEYRTLPTEEVGKFYVSGPTLALGYLNRVELSREKFFFWKEGSRVDNTGQPCPEGYVKVYYTGDLAKICDNGEIIVVGRGNDMVKVRGYSVVLGTVQVSIQAHPTVKSAAVVTEGKEGSDKKLIAYVVFEPDAKRPSIAEMQDFLGTMLPYYAIPSVFIILESLPLSATTGKLNVKLLPLSTTVPLNLQLVNDQSERRARSNSLTALRVSSTEAMLMGIWCTLLNLQHIGTHDNFFACGGHSLLAARLVSQINDKFEVQIPAATLFRKEFQTVETLASLIDTVKETGFTVVELFAKQAEEEYARTKASSADSKVPLEETKMVNRVTVQNKTIDFASEVKSFDQNFDSVKLLSKNADDANIEQVLLTGAAGYLGTHLLSEIQKEMPDAQILCLLRSEQGLQQLQHSVKMYALQVDWTRVRVVRGDLGKENCGLEADFKVDMIIHAGSEVNLVKSYNDLKRVNVGGTQQLLKIAAQNNAAFVYVSTLGVFKTFGSGGQASDNETSVTGPPEDLVDGYCQTKWVAEQLVLRYNRSIILRCGTLVGSARTGVWNDRDFLCVFFSTCLATGSFPLVPNWNVEVTLVDFAAAAVVRASLLLLDSVSDMRVYHIVSPHKTKYPAMVALLVDQMPNVKEEDTKTNLFSPWSDWLKQLQTTSHNRTSRVQAASQAVLALVSEYPSAEAFVSAIGELTNSCDATLKSLNAGLSRRLHLVCPPLTDALASTWFINAFAPFCGAPHPRLPLWDRICLVTGASSGIGASIARHLTAAGARVCIVARREPKLKALALELNRIYARTTASVCVEVCDVANRSHVKRAVKATESNFHGTVNVLVNCAGIMPFTNMASLHEHEWDKMVDVNCKGVMNGIGSVLGQMIAKKDGHIINISSDAGRKVFPGGLTVYSATKHFVEALSRGLRTEMALAEANIKVTCLQPGDVFTELANTTTDMDAKAEHGAYLQADDIESQILATEHIAEAAVYALSQPSKVAINELLIEPISAPI